MGLGVLTGHFLGFTVCHNLINVLIDVRAGRVSRVELLMRLLLLLLTLYYLSIILRFLHHLGLEDPTPHILQAISLHNTSLEYITT